jgi:protein ImuB
VLWLALHFPLLPLEALPLRQSPSVVVQRGRVLCGDGQAQAAGVAAGQRLSTALGLQPGLTVHERDAAAEASALGGLACWAGEFTPTLVLQVPDTLLLEVGGCLRLFGGIDTIVETVRTGCAAQSYSVAWAVAPTPLGAHWLARAGGGALCPELTGLRQRLAELPCSVTGWPAEQVDRLEAYGLRHLGDLRNMPAAGLRRRIGSAACDELLRAWGELPHPQKTFVFPERFSQKLELPARVEHAEALGFAGQRLFSALAGWLQGRQLLLRACTLQLMHDDATQTPLPLRFGEAAADAGRFSRLLREHLARLELPGPVEAMTLVADEVVPRSGDSASLFAGPPAGEGVAVCLERLLARLGEAAVQVLAERADYRPECATLSHSPLALPPEGSGSLAKASQRPLWLLPEPQALAEREDGPHWHGPLQLLSRAERLESGWWDEGEASSGASPATSGDVRRDYFVARNAQGQWAWIFRDAGGWFLHGLFA